MKQKLAFALRRSPGIGLQETEKIVLRVKDLVAKGFFTETDKRDICNDARNFWFANNEAEWLEKTGVAPPRYDTLEELEKIHIPWWKEKAAFAGIDATTILTPDNNGVPWWKILGISHGIEEAEIREVDREGILEKIPAWKPIIMGVLARQKEQKAMADKRDKDAGKSAESCYSNGNTLAANNKPTTLKTYQEEFSRIADGLVLADKRDVKFDHLYRDFVRGTGQAGFC